MAVALVSAPGTPNKDPNTAASSASPAVLLLVADTYRRKRVAVLWPYGRYLSPNFFPADFGSKSKVCRKNKAFLRRPKFLDGAIPLYVEPAIRPKTAPVSKEIRVVTTTRVRWMGLRAARRSSARQTRTRLTPNRTTRNNGLRATREWRGKVGMDKTGFR